MDLESLKEYLLNLSKKLSFEDQKVLSERLSNLKSVFPFNEYEYIIKFLLDKKVIDFQQYEDLRNEYISSNPYLELYSISPREFGEVWGHNHLITLDSRFKKPNKELDASYNGEYDLWFEGVKIEVKSCRATNKKKKGNVISKALRYDSGEPFWMNFQQIKVDLADIFIFIGVWVDKIIYWVMFNEEVKNNKYLSSQHRGGIEYQIGITIKNISEFKIFRVEPDKIGETILRKSRKF